MSDKLNIKNSGFKVPKDYFESLEDQVLSKIKAEQSLGQAKQPGFTLPDDYMSSLEDKVFNTINEQDRKVISLFTRRNVLYISGIAAAIVILFGIFMKGGSVEFEMDAEMAETYLMEQDLSTYELAALLTEEDITSLDEDIMSEAFTDNEMEDYLLENVNLEDIIEQ